MRELVGRIVGFLGCLAIVAVIVAVLAVVGLVSGQLTPFFEAPEEAASRFLAHVEEDELDAAYAMLCADLKERWSQGDLRAELDAQREGIGPSGFRIELTFPRGLDVMEVDYTWRGTVRSERVEMTLVREENAWRPCAFEWTPG